MTYETLQEILYLRVLSKLESSMHHIHLAVRVEKEVEKTDFPPWLVRNPKMPRKVLARLCEFDWAEETYENQYKITDCGRERLKELEGRLAA